MVTNEVKRTKLGGKMSKKLGKRLIFIHCNKKKGGNCDSLLLRSLTETTFYDYVDKDTTFKCESQVFGVLFFIYLSP